MWLQHSNIVKYHGFVKSAETLNIILEYGFLCRCYKQKAR